MGTGFTLPTSRPITQAYGAEFDDWDGNGTVDYPGGFYHSIGWDGHNGIDYGCHPGDPVEAVADGIVRYADWAGNHWLLSGGGIAVLIEHPEYGVQSEYLHLSSTPLNEGQVVKKGQVIGQSGNTGASTAPHLHLGMLPIKGINLNNRMRGRIDPTPYLYGELNPDYAKETPVTPAQMKELKNYFRALIVDGYTTGGVKHDGVAKVVEQNRVTLGNLPKLIWSLPIRRGGKHISALQELANANTALAHANTQIEILQAQVDVLLKAKEQTP